MEKATDNIRDSKIRAYFEETTEGRDHTIKLSADELEEGLNQYNDGMRKVMEEAESKIPIK